MKSKIIFCLLILPLCILKAQNPIDNFVNNPLLQYANISLLIRDLETDKDIYEQRSKHGVIPASTMKLVTTATALELLGPEYTFDTKIQIDKDIEEGGILNGNLYIRGGGDPTLGSKYMDNRNFLSTWVQAVKDAGITQINGSIIADDSLFDSEGINPRWIWEDIGNYYAPAIYGLSYMDNAVQVHFYSGTVGTTPRVLRTTPDIPGMTFENYLKSTNIGKDSAYFYGAPRINHRIIYGEIPANRNVFTSKTDMPNPGLVLASHLHDLLIKNGIKISSTPTYEIDKRSERKTIYTHASPPLKEIIKVINHRSNNQYAEYLFRYLALQNSVVASTHGSIQVVRRYWRSKGLPVDQLLMYDGSGLSPSNMVSANFLVHLLNYMKHESPYAKDFLESVPVCGQSGTVAGVLRNTFLDGKVHAKSGSLNRVRCYAGYIDINNKSYGFAVMTNNFNGTPRQVVTKIEQFLLSAMK